MVYRDVPINAWFASYVKILVERNIARGYQDAAGHLTGEFGAGNSVTGAEILKMALQAAGKILSTGTPENHFARNDWSALYVKTAEDLRLSEYGSGLDVRLPATRGAVIQTILEAFGTLGLAVLFLPGRLGDAP